MNKEKRETTEEIRNGKLIRITEEAWNVVSDEKVKQKKSKGQIASDLIIKEYKRDG